MKRRGSLERNVATSRPERIAQGGPRAGRDRYRRASVSPQNRWQRSVRYRWDKNRGRG